MKLWIDDLRPCPNSYDLHAYNYDQAIEFLEEHEITFVSFDHDLEAGPENKTGYDVVKWIKKKAKNGEIKPFEYDVHSANPKGSQNIKRGMREVKKIWAYK